ncbi:MAG: hypothetical protein EOM21_19675 [Gammaproteobacteria bacterium]|nr:hypothetical protein [Gammaproteobacteria bacterium]
MAKQGLRLPKGRRKPDVYTDTALRLAMTKEAHELEMTLEQYLEAIDYERPARTKADALVLEPETEDEDE